MVVLGRGEWGNQSMKTCNLSSTGVGDRLLSPGAVWKWVRSGHGGSPSDVFWAGMWGATNDTGTVWNSSPGLAKQNLCTQMCPILNVMCDEAGGGETLGESIRFELEFTRRWCEWQCMHPDFTLLAQTPSYSR
jgi:hypothetical protein